MAIKYYIIKGGAYSDMEFGDLWEALFIGGSAASMGVLKGAVDAIHSEFSATGATSPVTVGHGWIVSKECIIFVDADTSVTVATPAGSTRKDRIVLRYTHATTSAAVTLIAGAEGGDFPAVTQTEGTTWDTPLWKVTITTGGAITLTDERTYCSFSSQVVNSSFGDRTAASVIGRSAATAGAPADIAAASDHQVLRRDGTTIAFGALTHEFMTDRTRTVFVPAIGGRDITLGTPAITSTLGIVAPDGSVTDINGFWQVPVDFVSTLTATAVVLTTTSGNVYSQHEITYGGSGEDYNVHTGVSAYAAVALVTPHLTQIQTVSLASAAIADYVILTWIRDATNVLDTIADVVDCIGWLVSYTSDM